MRLLREQKYVLVGNSGLAGAPIKEIVQKHVIIDFNPRDDMTFTVLSKYNLDLSGNIGEHYSPEMPEYSQDLVKGIH